MTRREAIDQDGYIVVQGLLSPDEVKLLKNSLTSHFAREWAWESLGKHQPNAAIKIPEISWLFTHTPILSVFRELYGQETLVFTGNCDAHVNMLNSWHKDVSLELGALRGESFFSPECRIYRAGVYLQDHDRGHDGLTVRRGSHRSSSKNTGDIAYLQTKAGDVVFFDARLTHTGRQPDWFEFLLYRLVRRLNWPKLGFYVKESYWKIVRKAPKLSVFFTYGTMDGFTREFCAFEFQTKSKDKDVESRYLPASFVRSLSQAGIVPYSDLVH